MVGKLDEYLRFNETVLSLRAQRQQLLASNIANADTPNYKARDIDFNKALHAALSDAEKNTEKNTEKRTSANTFATFAGTALLYRTVQQGSIDGNTVDMDVERNQFVDNAVRYEAGLTMVSGQIKSMLAAIQG